MSDLSKKQSAPPRGSRRNMESISTALKWLTLLNVHYKAGLTDEEIEIYLEPLSKYGAGQLEDAFVLCREECIFMPRVADIIERVAPEKNYFSPDPPAQPTPADRDLWRRVMAENKESLKAAPAYEGKRWSAEDGWLPRAESLAREAERDSSRKMVASWHAPIKGPNIRP